MRIAKYPVSLAEDPGNHTIYVTHSYGRTVSVTHTAYTINSASHGGAGTLWVIEPR